MMSLNESLSIRICFHNSRFSCSNLSSSF